MKTDEHRAFIRRCVRDIFRRANIISLQRLALATAAAFANGADLDDLLVHEDALERERMRGTGYEPDAAA